MFYSQFILAKKGPLGTIWIAAHLERKLRKNQVADTDIGLSVDSILFPEVPIALRLSSHLLLGVVRIYSKKVNYLFHDCSEALVKIKQAFRSTTVDLPPEESTAPYHSITLPETFDLDNFELPESALLSSNFVDHHVSTREQITLQDAVNGTHPTSMFGLDEKFGDGDASHIGLELEQELFMDKHFSPLPASFSIGFKEGVFHGEPSLPSTSLGNDGQFSYNEGNFSEIPNELSELLCNNHDREGFSSSEALRRNEDKSHRHIYSIQTPDLNEVFIPDCQLAPSPYIALTPEEVQTPCLIEPAQGPSTPGLLEEVIPSNFQEIPALSPHERAAMPAEPGRPWSSSGPFMEVEYSEAGIEAGHTDTLAVDHSSGGTAEGLSSSVVFEQRSGSLALTHLAENLTTHNSCLPSGTEHTIGKSTGNEVNDLSVAEQMQDNGEVILPSAISDETGNLDLHIKLATFSGAEPISSNFSTDNVNKVDVSGAVGDAKTTVHNSTEPSNTSNLNHAEDIGSCLISRNTSAIASGFHLRPCSSNLHQDATLVEISEQSRGEQFCSLEIPIREEAPHICESSREVQGDDLRSTNFGDSNLEQQQKPGYMSSGVKSGAIEPLELSMCGLSNVNKPDRFNYSSSSEFLEPEKMLAPACFADFPNDSRQQTADKGVAESDGSADRISTLSKVSQQDHLNYFSSSKFLEPEMLAPAFNVDLSNDRGHQTRVMGVAESDGSVDRFSTLYNKKRQAMHGTTVQQTGTAAKSSGVPRSWRNSVPDDDDLLASILVGRKSQFLKTGTKLSPSTASSHKRPRTMPKVGLLKGRKVLVDDTVFLHADTIRQQLLNTEDIRRIRKKVPCTRPDIWKIHIYEEEDEIFKNCVLTGVAAELNSLECKRYNLHVNPSAQVKIHNSLSNPSEESQLVNEAGGKVLGDGGPSGADMEQAHEDADQSVVKEQIEQMPVRPQMEPLNEGQGSLMSEIESVAWRDSDLKMTATCITENAETCPPLEKHDNESINDSMLPEVEADARGGFHLSMTEAHIAENGETCLPIEKPDTSSIDIMQQSLLSEDWDRRNTPLDGLERATMETDDPVVFMDSEQVNPEDESNPVGTSSKEADISETHIAENGETCLPLEKPDASSINIMEQTLLSEDWDRRNTPLDGLECATMETTDDPTVVFMESEQIHAEDESNAVGTSSKEKEKHANDVDMEHSECSQTRLSHSIEIDGASVSVRRVAADSGAELLLEESFGLAAAVEGHSLKVPGNEGRSIPGTCPEVELMASISAPTEHIPFIVEENTFVQEHDLEANSMDVAGARDSSDFCSTIDDNYAELLNVDDEAPNPEAAKLFENSGWSVRTRGVAKYLKNLFHEESVRGRRTVAVDRLLFGKTRKEASRMFFETLVLKSMDYIQVEQETPFAYINIKPRIKLVESEF